MGHIQATGFYMIHSVPVVIKYGLFYNWYAANDTRNICIAGWHIQTYAEWQSLVTYLGGSSVAGGKLKETGTTYWISPNTGATNEVGFNGRGSNFRYGGDLGSGFYGENKYAVFWSLTEIDATHVHNIGLYYISQTTFENSGSQIKSAGNSIRPMKDSTSLSSGQTGKYIGNDGKVYRTICINGVEYLADNLAETKYRNGDSIPEVSGNTEWGALTTGALCAYNNNWDNV